MTDIVVCGKGSARFGGRECRCALGSAGIVDRKVEGDGGTPAGVWPLRRVLFRPDREAWPEYCQLQSELAAYFNDVTDHLVSRVMGSGGRSTLDLK